MATFGDPSIKKQKVEDELDIFETFFKNNRLFDTFMNAFEDVLVSLKECLLPAVINLCDGQVAGRFGRPFHSCICEASAKQTIPFHFGAFFENGVDIFNSLQLKKVPDNLELRRATFKLLNYLVKDQVWHDELKHIQERCHVTGKTQLMVTLAEHFFSRLSVSKEYVMDRNANNSEICKCGNCERERLSFDDTSLGHPKVWHGSLDVLFDSCAIAVPVHATSDEQDLDDSTRDKSTTDIEIEHLDSKQARSQAISQTIVFSFLQKQRHPDSKHCLIPNIVANSTGVKLIFYDAMNDILLESRQYDFFLDEADSSDTDEELPNGIMFHTVIASWLVLNHKILCSGPYQECLDNAPSSRFRELAKDALPIYESDLKLRNAFEKEYNARPFLKWFNLKYYNLDKDFVWPSSVCKPDTS